MHIFIVTTEWPTSENPYAVPFLSRHIKLLRESGIEVEVFHFRGNRNPLNYLKSWWQIRRSPFWKKADIFHAHWGQSALLALFSRKKLVITYHGSDLQGIIGKNGKYTTQGRILIILSRLMAYRADFCIVVSSRLAKLLPKKCKLVQTIPIGIDLNEFHPMDKQKCREYLNLNKDTKIILFLSDPTRPEKRFSLAQEAVCKYQTNHPEIKIQLLVVSEIPHSIMPTYINSGDVLILTSTHEGSPTVVKEALACKVPIVSFDVGDVAERISGIKGCYLCKEEKIDCLINGLQIALANGPLRSLPESALNQIDECSNISNLINIYRHVLKI